MYYIVRQSKSVLLLSARLRLRAKAFAHDKKSFKKKKQEAKLKQLKKGAL